jgi:hypothetical protein
MPLHTPFLQARASLEMGAAAIGTIFLMNLCEKSASAANIYKGFVLLKKPTFFRGVKILFCPTSRRFP